jgi:hypothetical protein
MVGSSGCSSHRVELGDNPARSRVESLACHSPVNVPATHGADRVAVFAPEGQSWWSVMHPGIGAHPPGVACASVNFRPNPILRNLINPCSGQHAGAEDNATTDIRVEKGRVW